MVFGVAVFIGYSDTGDNKGLVDVHAAADRINDFYGSCHYVPLFRINLRNGIDWTFCKNE
jgi:hypothetical protein